MSKPMTINQFQDAVKKYRDNHGLSISELATKLGKGESTVRDWIRLGIKTDDIRQKTVEKYPWLFEAVTDQASVAGLDGNKQSFLMLLKTDHAHLAVSQLTIVLRWFLFQASTVERNYFRDTLGEDWKHFLDLTRAM